jgi:hypothetical protein
MALLTSVHWETATPAMRQVLRFVGTRPFAARFYLAGGTALALRLGHRRSVDLDFFSQHDEVTQATRREIVRALIPLDPQVLEEADGNLLLQLADLHVGFFSYGYPLLAPAERLEGVALASLVDIGLMKLDALAGRGNRKDFYDVYVISQKMPLAELLSQGAIKYPYMRDFEMMTLESLVLFEDADRHVTPELFIDAPWAQVKQFFIDQARALGQEWFGIQGKAKK